MTVESSTGSRLPNERLAQIVATLVRRPGHETVRALLRELLVVGLGVPDDNVQLENPLPQVHGRVDALVGRTAIEVKSDLRREVKDAEEKLLRYLTNLEATSRVPFLGIATDGHTFKPYCLRKGALAALQPYIVAQVEPRNLLIWLDASIATNENLDPDPEVLKSMLGRDGLAWQVARQELGVLWEEVAASPDVSLKRELWADLLEVAYGSNVDRDDLFFQHTYLTILAKSIATRVLGIGLPTPEELLAGKAFQDVGISGAVESDFFDWILAARAGASVVGRISREVLRFRFEGVQQDVLKGLYESLIDPEQRHDLGEYYTPDWLAARICSRVIATPLSQKILDPACGSGTFLFHAVRRYLEAADSHGLSNSEALPRCCAMIRGVDVHPVAVLIARVTYLLAIGERRLQDRPSLVIPVYLGDSLQWKVQAVLAGREVRIPVPGGPELCFPAEVTGNPSLLDRLIATMLDLSSQGAGVESFQACLRRVAIQEESSIETLLSTYRQLRILRDSGRDHIWGYVARNLSRPIWLSSEDERADVVLGNPPWLEYGKMSTRLRPRFRRECIDMNIWVGGNVATHQDLSAYFFARCVELYLRSDGVIAFVMPYAVLNCNPFVRFCTGEFRDSGTSVHFLEAWSFDEDVQPLFPVPSCVLIARQGVPSPVPSTVTAFKGVLPRRDASPEEADLYLTYALEPRMVRGEPQSPYHGLFRQGATVLPRMLFVVQRVPPGILGANPDAPQVESRKTPREKPPWRSMSPLREPVEASFLRPLYLGESVAPYRLLRPSLAVIPWDSNGGRLINAGVAQQSGYLRLAKWLQSAERLWNEGREGREGRTLLEQLDYYGKLSSQFPIRPIRVVYSASGTSAAAAVLVDEQGIVEHSLYWAAVDTLNEARYLTAILNSDVLRDSISKAQPKGQWGPRHFDKLLLHRPIPKLEPTNALHLEIVRVSERAEAVAAAVQLSDESQFIGCRQDIRRALDEEGISRTVNNLVAGLLEGQPFRVGGSSRASRPRRTLMPRPKAEYTRGNP